MSGRETLPAGRPSTFSPRKKEFRLGDKPYKGYLSQDCDLKKLFKYAVLILYLRIISSWSTETLYRVYKIQRKKCPSRPPGKLEE
jgi:hypothetical protein